MAQELKKGKGMVLKNQYIIGQNIKSVRISCRNPTSLLAMVGFEPWASPLFYSSEPYAIPLRYSCLLVKWKALMSDIEGGFIHFVLNFQYQATMTTMSPFDQGTFIIYDLRTKKR